MQHQIRSIAILVPLDDYGVCTYCHELAMGLAVNGVEVDIYAAFGSRPKADGRSYGFFPVLGSALFRQRKSLQEGIRDHDSCASAGSSISSSIPKESANSKSRLRSAIREQFLSLELALHLKRKRYDVIWTQWPDMDGYGISFWKFSKLLRMKVVHLVHNVLPHESSPRDKAFCDRLYRVCDLLFVHSKYSRKELLNHFPGLDQKTLITQHGLYTIYPRRPEARERVRRELNIPSGTVALLFCGGVRPYKNIDPVIASLRDERCLGAILIVAGVESGYTDSSSEDRLARTRRIATEFGVLERVRLIPRFLDTFEMAELFEAGDVLTLPYLENYGSGQLLLGTTFGKYIIATVFGGLDEYLVGYPNHTLLQGTETDSVLEGICEAVESVNRRPAESGPARPDLEWSTIARRSHEAMNRFYSHGISSE